MVYYGRLGKRWNSFLNKISLICCKWSSLIAQGSENPVSDLLRKSSFIQYLAPTASFLPLSLQYAEAHCEMGLRNGLFLEAGKKAGIFLEQNLLNRGEFRNRERPVVTHLERPVARECETRLRLQMVQFECPEYRKPCVSFTFR